MSGLVDLLYLVESGADAEALLTVGLRATISLEECSTGPRLSVQPDRQTGSCRPRRRWSWLQSLVKSPSVRPFECVPSDRSRLCRRRTERKPSGRKMAFHGLSQPRRVIGRYLLMTR